VLLIKATPAGYQEQGRFHLPEETQKYKQQRHYWTYPILANGNLYLRDQELIFCYDVRKSK
jgi:outer membrane protein assembly factor BamB